MSTIPTKPRTIQFSVLDISAHPHPEGTYVKLFKKARKLRRAIKIVGDEYAELSEISSIKDPETGGVVALRGTLYRFVQIDVNSPWFDRSTGEGATEEVMKENDVSWLKKLSPNTKHLFWYFDVENHTLVIVCKNGKETLSPDQAAAFFGTILNMAAGLIDEIEIVDVTTRKSKESIERIFGKPRVTKLELDLKRPNADSASNAEENILEQMEEEGSARWQEELTAQPGGTLKKSQRLEELMQASIRLGTTKAVTYDSSEEREEINTKNHPVIKKRIFEPAAKISLIDFVVDFSVELVGELFKKKD